MKTGSETINYDTVSEATADLIKRGYKYNFNLADDRISSSENDVSFSPDEFEIDEIHRFEGESDPGDEFIVYAISAKNMPIKGILVNAYGPYSNSMSHALVEKLSKPKDS
jgi:hypothetical protein